MLQKKVLLLLLYINHMQQEPIVVQAIISAPIEKVWECWNTPDDITGWAFASNDWEAPRADNDLRPGGRFSTRMQAKDGSAGFDFSGTYTAVTEHERIEYDMDDRRHVKTVFVEVPDGVEITTTFDPETENPIEMQKAGWQAILDNFKKYVESKK